MGETLHKCFIPRLNPPSSMSRRDVIGVTNAIRFTIAALLLAGAAIVGVNASRAASPVGAVTNCNDIASVNAGVSYETQDCATHGKRAFSVHVAVKAKGNVLKYKLTCKGQPPYVARAVVFDNEYTLVVSGHTNFEAYQVLQAPACQVHLMLRLGAGATAANDFRFTPLKA